MHTLSLAMNYQATEKLMMNASFTYNKADDTWDWDFNDRPSLEFGGSAKPTYDTVAINNLIDEYSDLSYQQYEVSVGGTYNFTDNLYASASVTYDMFASNEEYVYGDEDGNAYYGYFGVGYRF